MPFSTMKKALSVSLKSTSSFTIALAAVLAGNAISFVIGTWIILDFVFDANWEHLAKDLLHGSPPESKRTGPVRANAELLKRPLSEKRSIINSN